MSSSENNPPIQNLVFEMQISVKDPQSSDSVTLNFALTADKPINVSFSSLNTGAALAVPSSSQGPSRRVGDNKYEFAGVDYLKSENTPRPRGAPGAVRVPGYDIRMEPHHYQCTPKCKEEKYETHQFYGVDNLKKEEPANDPEFYGVDNLKKEEPANDPEVDYE